MKKSIQLVALFALTLLGHVLEEMNRRLLKK